jgi:hypothetical protein
MDNLKEKVLKRLGHNFARGVLNATVEDLLDEQLGLAIKLLQPRKIIRASVIAENTGAKVVLQEGLTIASAHIATLLARCESAWGFAVTIGKALEEKRDHQLTHNDRTRAILLDSIGSVAVEDLAQEAQNEIQTLANTSHQEISRRFSPGYGDWLVQGQKEFLAWLEAEKINITLTPHYLMIPEKSISAIVGVKKNA